MAQEAGKLDHPRRRERLNARTCADQEHGGEVDHPRRTGRLRALTRSDQEHGGVADHPHCSRRNRAQTCADQEYNGENTNEVDRSSRRRLEPQSSLDQEADGEADCPRYNLRLRSRPVVRKESKVPNMVKKPKNEYFLYIDYYREKQKANGRKLNAPNASREAMWMWRKMSDAVVGSHALVLEENVTTL
ncbi:hypothetical protein D1007_62254 [Hordeum vulgare]|nr:hypothetical protein D1007_62254 [Hordeum vulgare]